MMRDHPGNWYLSIGPRFSFSIPSFNRREGRNGAERHHPDGRRQVRSVMAALHGGISSDPGPLSSSIFSRSSNRQGQKRPRWLDSQMVMDPLVANGLIPWKALGAMGQTSITWTQSFVDSLTYKQKKEKSDTTDHCDTQTHSRSEEPWPFKQGRPCSFASSQSHLITICEDLLAWVLMWTIPLKQLVFGCFKPVGLTGAPLMEPRHICRPGRSRCPLSPFPFMSPTRVIV